MTLYCELPDAARALTGCICMCLSIAMIWCLVRNILMRVPLKYRRFSVFSVLVTVLLMMGISDFEHDSARRAELSVPARMIGNLPWMVIYVILLLMICGVSVQIFFIRRLQKEILTADSIRESFDTLPDGICFSTENGVPILTNVRMSQLCSEIFQKGITDTEKLWQALWEGQDSEHVRFVRTSPVVTLQLNDGSVWDFRRRKLRTGREWIWENIACDVTEQYRLNQELKTRNQKLNQLNERLQKFCKEISSYTREKEILETRIRVHDDVGRALLMWRTYLEEEENQKNRKEVVFWWKYIVTGIRSGNLNHSEKEMHRLEAEAGAVNFQRITEPEKS